MIGSAAGDGGIPHGGRLVAFAEAVVAGDERQLASARALLAEAIGEAGLVDAAGVVGFFSAIDRVADATGIPLDRERLETTGDLRAQLGIDAFGADRS